MKLAEVDEVRGIAIQLPGEIAVGLGFRVERAVNREIGVHIAEEADAARLQCGDAGGQVGVALRVPLPVPKQAAAEAGLADADPVLAPQARDGRARVDQPFEALERGLALLEAHHRAAQSPIRERVARTEARGQLARQVGGRALEQVDGDLARPHVDAQAPRLARVELHIFGIGEADRPATRAQHGRLGVIGGPVVPAREAPVGARLIGKRRAGLPPDAGFAGPDREIAAIKDEVAHLLAPAPQHVVRSEREVDGHAVMATQRRKRQPRCVRRKRHRDFGAAISACQHRAARPIHFCLAQWHRCHSIVGKPEIAAHHGDLRRARRHGNREAIRSMAEHRPACQPQRHAPRFRLQPHHP